MSAAPSIVNEVKLNQPIEAPEPRLRGTNRPRPTPAELLVITLRAAGKSLKEIAIELNLALATVETHMSNIYRKMGWTSIVDLVHFALAHRLVDNKYAPPKKKGRVEEFFEHNLGRKYLASDLIRLFGPSVAETISEINLNDLAKVTVLLQERERGVVQCYWAIER